MLKKAFTDFVAAGGIVFYKHISLILQKAYTFLEMILKVLDDA